MTGARGWPIALAALAACATEVPRATEAPEAPDAAPATIDQEAIGADNGIFLDNGLKLTNGADAGNGIKLTNGFNLANGLDLPNGIKLTNGVNTIEPPPGSDLERWIDVDPTMRLRIIRYQVECALPSGVAVEVIYRGEHFSFVGQIGLGPGWQDGLMSVAEQERVSACLLARVNARGDRLRIILVGPYPGLDTLSDAERDSYPTREASFIGNLFVSSAPAYVAGVQPCGGRACKVDVAAGLCDCGIIDAIASCHSDGADYDTECRPDLVTTWENPMTTYVAQWVPGGACAVDSDCVYHNCGAGGACGGDGVACLWDYMCASPLVCGDDRTCSSP